MIAKNELFVFRKVHYMKVIFSGGIGFHKHFTSVTSAPEYIPNLKMIPIKKIA